MSSKPLYAIGFTLAIGILVIGVLYLFSKQGNLITTPTPSISSEQITQEASPSAHMVSYKCEVGENAFDLLKSNISNVQSDSGEFGEFVTSINGVEQGGGKYWLYSVDGQDATVSASAYFCQDQEDIKWELK